MRSLLDSGKLHVGDLLAKNSFRSVFTETIPINLQADFKRDGMLVFEDFLDPVRCDALRDAAAEVYKSNSDLVSIDSNGSDERIYGVERLDRRFVELREDLRLWDQLYEDLEYRFSPEDFLLLGRITAAGSNLGSGSGWHRDSAFAHQFKYILYLSDVTEENGPFQYIPGSHTSDSISATAKILQTAKSKYRYSDEDVNQLIDKKILNPPVTVTGSKGTLLFADTRGIHRGRPLRAGQRYALTRYYFGRGISKEFLSLYPLLSRPLAT